MKVYFTNCIESKDGGSINNMKRHAWKVTRRTFLKHVNRHQLSNIEANLWYADHHSRGLTMASDEYVGYFKSMFKNRPCVYFAWSGMEHIFVEETP